LEPIEDWLQRLSKLMNFAESELEVFRKGHRTETTYEKPEMIETVKYLDENKNRVIGIVNSKVLFTNSTKKICEKLIDYLNILDADCQDVYKKLIELNSTESSKDGTDKLFQELSRLSAQINTMTQELHGCLSILKIKYT
jgi:hypothetical protein